MRILSGSHRASPFANAGVRGRLCVAAF